MPSTNLVVIMSDQHHPRAMGAPGHTLVRTPNLDQPAERGTRFAAAYCNSPICVPSRASFATGRYVHDIGTWDNAMAYDGSVPGWGHALQRAGHRVESSGKLHYRNAEDPTGFDRQYHPMHIVAGHGMVWGRYGMVASTSPPRLSRCWHRSDQVPRSPERLRHPFEFPRCQ